MKFHASLLLFVLVHTFSAVTASQDDITRAMYDSISSLVTGSSYPDIWWEERLECFSQLSPTLLPSLESGWRGMLDYWITRGGDEDPWNQCQYFNMSIYYDPNISTRWFELNCTTQPIIEMDIWEPCNYASNLAYDRLVLEMYMQDNWTFPQHTVTKIAEAFSLVTFGSAFMHGSNTHLGGKMDLTSNDLFVYIVYQAGVSNLPYHPVIHDLAYEPR